MILHIPSEQSILHFTGSDADNKHCSILHRNAQLQKYNLL